jgi:esterase/lipase
MIKQITLIVAILSINYLFAQPKITTSQEQTISILIRGVTIEGSLLSGSKEQKLVILIAGSGPTDRNGNSIAGVNCNSYKMIAEELAKNNISSFRYDKRGIAKSVIKNFKENDLSFDDYVNDAIAIYNYFKDSLGFKKLYFAGHSEGSLIAMIASEKTNANGYISISGAGRPIDVIITEQITKQSPLIAKQADSLFSILKTKNKLDSVPPYLLSLFRPSIQPYMVSWMRYDPQTEIKNVQCPIIIFQGTCDIQVKTKDAENLYTANKKAKLDLIEGMTHVLKNAEDNCIDKNLNTYHDPTLPLNIQFLKDIVSFIQSN